MSGLYIEFVCLALCAVLGLGLPARRYLRIWRNLKLTRRVGDARGDPEFHSDSNGVFATLLLVLFFYGGLTLAVITVHHHFGKW